MKSIESYLYELEGSLCDKIIHDWKMIIDLKHKEKCKPIITELQKQWT